MKNTYSLSGMMNGECIQFHKKFHSRNQAVDYMLRFYENNWIINPEIDHEDQISKHNINYVCTNGNRFNIRRNNA